MTKRPIIKVPEPLKESIFTKILNKEVPSQIIYEDEKAFAINDISPQASVHFLVIPKEPLISLAHAEDSDVPLLGHLLKVVRDLAETHNLTSGYRVVINTGLDAGQTVHHLHLHVLAGEPLGNTFGNNQPKLQPKTTEFLNKRLRKGVQYFDSGEYNMNQGKLTKRLGESAIASPSSNTSSSAYDNIEKILKKKSESHHPVSELVTEESIDELE